MAVYRARTNFEIKFSNHSEFNNSQVQLKKGDSESSDQTKSTFNQQVPINSSGFVPNQVENEEDIDFEGFPIKGQFLRISQKANNDRDSPVSRDCLLNNENESNNSEEALEEQRLKNAATQRALSLNIPTKKKKFDNEDTFLSNSLNPKLNLNKSRAKSESLNI